jgi:hypothetical protein
VIKPYLDTINTAARIVTNEQWDLFFQQIQMTNLSHLRNLHKRELRNYVNAHKNDSLIQRLLAEQRFTLFKMVITRDTLIPLPPENAVSKYYVQKRKFEALKKRTASQAAILEQAQLKAYAEMIANEVHGGLAIVRDDRFPFFQYHDVMFKYLVTGGVSGRELYTSLHNLGRLKYFRGRLKEKLVYNNLVLIYRNYDNIEAIMPMMDVEKLYCPRYRKSEFHVRRFKRLHCWKSEQLFPVQYYLLKEFPYLITLGRKQGFKDFDTNALQKFYTTSMINILYESPFPEEIFEHVARIKTLYHPNDNALSLDERVRLASFYCAFDKTEVARNLLTPVINDPNLDVEGRKLFITLQFDIYKDEHEFVNYVMEQYQALGNTEWCNLLTDGRYLSHVLLEDIKLKKFYNCNCHHNESNE